MQRRRSNQTRAFRSLCPATLSTSHAEVFPTRSWSRIWAIMCRCCWARRAADRSSAKPAFERNADLGCGKPASPAGRSKEMVDERQPGSTVAENMVEIAHEKGLYDTLYVRRRRPDVPRDNDDRDIRQSLPPTDVLPLTSARSSVVLRRRPKNAELPTPLFTLFKRNPAQPRNFEGRPYNRFGGFSAFPHQPATMSARHSATAGFEK